MIEIEYGRETLSVQPPVSCDVKTMGSTKPLGDPVREIRRSYEQPIDSPPLAELARRKLENNPGSKAVIVVSDNTRPVPYRGEKGILAPLLRTLIAAGYSQDKITLLIGNGSHRNMTPEEIEETFGLRAAGFPVAVVNHEYEDEDNLVLVGQTRRGSQVRINRLYVEADFKITTGLVESHFVAGTSGGRKAICPGIAGKETLRIFHGPQILSSAKAADLILEGNPCSEEAEQAAELAGCDFSVNVTLDAAMNITGVFSGDISAAHRAAVEKIREYVVVALEKRYDLVLIPAGFVGVNHYQTAKAAIEASRAVIPGGMIVVAARHSDFDPIGSEEYRKTLAMLKSVGRQEFLRIIQAPDWIFTHDQWETQIWGKVLAAIGSEQNLIYCSLEIPVEDYTILPGVCGLSLLSAEELAMGQDEARLMKTMLERALAAAVRDLRRSLGRDPEMLFLRDGPYGVPVVRNL